MLKRTVVFVHGFLSSADCWEPFLKFLRKDSALAAEGFSFVTFQYPTKILELNPKKRIPTIRECGESLGAFLDRLPECDQLFLVGHSMGGLVIQSHLARKIQTHLGDNLARIRSVILFATPNRGATILSAVREIFRKFSRNEQEEDLMVLNSDVADMGEIITRSILGARSSDAVNCPIPFTAFWGLQDNVVPETSARGSFSETHPLDGDHSKIIEPGSADDERYLALQDALLNPVGHPWIYEIDLFEVTLAIAPVAAGTTFTLSGDVKPLPIQPDNKAIRSLRLIFSKKNRCAMPYTQVYRSTDGLVELVSLTQPNNASRIDKSEYRDTGKRFTYVFTPKGGHTYDIKLQIFNGFGELQRTWHNHMDSIDRVARYKLFRFTLDLQAYREAGYAVSSEPAMFYYSQDNDDHALCAQRGGEKPLPPLPDTNSWFRTWEMTDVNGGVIDLVWDVARKQAH